MLRPDVNEDFLRRAYRCGQDAEKNYARRFSRTATNAPALTVRSIYSSTLPAVVHPVFRMAGVSCVAGVFFDCTVTSWPLIPGTRTSIVRKRGWILEALPTAAGPLAFNIVLAKLWRFMRFSSAIP